MKTLVKKILFTLLRLFGGKAFSNPAFNPVSLLKHLIIQKIFRINSNIPWPVHWTSVIKSPENIDKGNRNPGLSMGCYIDGRNGIKFGENVWVGPKVSIISMNHKLDKYTEYETTNPIIIGDNCWIGAGATILPGVELGIHVIVAAGAVVTNSFKQDNIVIAGVPAKIVKEIGDYSEETSNP